MSHPSDLYRSVRSSSFPDLTYPSSSIPACAWNESGGSFASRRLVSTAFALTPAPPAIAAFTYSVSGLFALNTVSMAARPSASPPDAHQVKISSCGSAATVSSVAAVSSAAFSDEQPAARSAITARPAATRYELLRIHIPFSARVFGCSRTTR